MTPTQEKTCALIFAKYGLDVQKMQTIQELAGLTVALTARPNQGTLQERAENIREEIADVMIMTEQLAQAYGREKINDIIDAKLRRQILRMNK